MLQTIIYLAVAALAVWSLLYVVHQIRRQLKGRCAGCGPSCNGDCSGCSSCGKQKKQ